MSPRKNHRARTPSRRPLTPRSPAEALTAALEWAQERESKTLTLRVSEARALKSALDAQIERITELEAAMRRIGHVGELAANNEPGVLALTIRQGKRQAYTSAMFFSVSGTGADQARRLTEDYIEDVIGVLTEERV